MQSIKFLILHFDFFRRNVRSSTKETAKIPPTNVSPTKKRKKPGETESTSKEQRAKKSPTKVMKEEKPTRFSPRRNTKSAVEKNKRYVDVIN